jgi:phosphoribosylformylglycinamidine cyclo-ligase
LPDGLDALVDLSSWTPLPVFGWLSKSAGIAANEMLRTFNCGLGMIAVVAPEKADAVIAAFGDGVRIGTLVKGDGEAKVRYTGTLKL